MSPEEWKEVKEIFNEAVDLEGNERRKYLDGIAVGSEIAARVVELLEADQRNSFNETPAADLSHLWLGDETPEAVIGKQVGLYKIVEELGRGGMGIVYKAVHEADDFERLVALKLLKRGMDSIDVLRRFRQERKILASLEHPNIARLLDGGIHADGLPFFAMELVIGKALDRYCAENILSIPERLYLFQQICQAVSFAHSRLVVHRDLKPSNILVTEDGRVKLLDFGIAKILSSENENVAATATQFGMMTPKYASPEQVNGSIISTSSDVYALGLILYELLTGQTAYKFESSRADEVARVINKVEPVRPSSVVTCNSGSETDKSSTGRENTGSLKEKRLTNKSLRGDLDNIVLKALRKEPHRRYASVEQFSEDIRRHLEGLPVMARAATISYQLEKFVSRNRVSVTAVFLLFLTLIAGIAATGWQAVRAEQQRLLAEKRFSEVRELANAFVFKYHDEIKDLPGSTRLREMLVNDALTYLNRLSADETNDLSLKIELAQAFMKIGDAQGQAYNANLGDTAGAIESYRKAVELLEFAAQKSGDVKISNELMNAYQKFSLLLSRSGQAESAEFSEKAIAIGETLLAADPENSEQILNLSGAYLSQGDILAGEYQPEKTIEIYKKALKLAENVYLTEPENQLALRRFIGLNQRLGFQYFLLASGADETGEAGQAADFHKISLPYYRQSLTAAEKQFAVDSNNAIFRRTFFALKINVAQVERQLGETDRAMKAQRQALEEFTKVAASDAENFEAKSDLALVYDDLALTLAKRGEFDAAFENHRNAIRLMNEAVDNDPNNQEFWRSRRDMEMRYANTLLSGDEFEKASEMYKLAFNEAKTAPMLQDVGWQNLFAGEMHEKLGDVQAAQNDWQSARTNYEKALHILGNENSKLATAIYNRSKINYLRKKAKMSG